MEIAIGLVGAALVLPGVILTYIWRANGRYMRELLEGRRRLMEGQERIVEGIRSLQEGQKEIARGIGEVVRIAQEALRELRAR